MKILNEKNIFWLLMVLFVASFVQFVNTSFTFDPVYSLYTDSANTYPFQYFIDHSLFSKDLIGHKLLEYYSRLDSGMWFSCVYRVLLEFLPLQVALKVVAIFLCLMSTIVVHRWATGVFQAGYAIFFSGIFLMYFLSMDTFFGGVGRGFGAFLYLLFVFLISKERFFWAIVCPVAAIFLYPSIVFGMLVTSCLVIVLSKDGHFERVRHYWHIGVAAFILLLGCFLIRQGLFATVLIHLKDIQTYKFYQNVMTPISMSDPVAVFLYFVLNLNEHSMLYKYLTCFFLLASVGVMCSVKQWWILPRHIWIILCGATLAFLISLPFHPTTASRQFVFTAPFFLLVFVAYNLNKSLLNKKINFEMWLPCLIFLFLIAHVLFNDIVSFRQYKPVYDYLAHLPKDVLIAGSTKSDLVRMVPFFTKRPVFFSEKMRDTWCTFFSADFASARRKDAIDAFYADSLESVRAFILANGVSYFIVESKFYDENGRRDLFLTGNTDELRVYNDLHKKLDRKQFALLKFAENNYDFMSAVPGNRIFIVSSSKILEK